MRSAIGSSPGRRPRTTPRRPTRRGSPWRCRATSWARTWPCSDLKEAEALWQARDAARGYLISAEAAQRSEQAARLESVQLPSAAPATPDPIHRLELLTRIVQLMPPPRHDPAEPIDKTTLHRVLEDENAEPTEYAVRLPPEYHPLRSYPALVVLHSGPGPAAAIDEWSEEAARHGYILIAPEYNLPGHPHDYRYTTSEHAAVELALRDARKRYAIDSDRVFVAGQLTGGNMAWDYSLAHPDLFAGVVVFSGLPAKYVPKYSPHHERLPLYCVLGELAPAAGEVIYNNLLKPMISLKAWDVTYVEYQRRGLETFPEEVPRAFDWMDRHRRDPFPKAFKVFAARPSDNRFYGVVVHELRRRPHHRARGRRALRPEPQPRRDQDELQQPEQPHPARSQGRPEPRPVAQPQAHRLQEEAGDPRQRPALRARPERPPQAGSRDDARRPPPPRRPAAALLAQDFHRLVSLSG